MVLDPLSAVGLAGNIIQFIDFCGNVISESRKTYQSAAEASPENIELERIAADVRQLCKEYQHPNGGEAISAELARVIASCDEVAVELHSVIAQLKVKSGPHRKWRSFHQALVTVWKKDKLSGLPRRLSSLREQVTHHLVSALSTQQHIVLKYVRELRDESKSMYVNRDQKLDAIYNVVESLQLSRSSMPFKNDLDHIHQALRDSTSVVTNISAELEILRSLRFSSMEVRHSNIAEAYQKTFDWVFNTGQLPLHDPRAAIGFGEWLRSKSGIFWISGKAGSGKSTLMKYICDDARTTARLRQWAGDSDLVKASFFFWSAGTDMQKSQQGLLQSLLYEILSTCPDLISHVCPERWNANDTSSSSIRRSRAWRLAELSRAFECLQSLASTSRKFCFFIDGLDEYDGDHFELIDTMVKLAKSPDIKLCLSSRPWNCFEDAFGRESDRKLYLQDLTRKDIEIYVKSKLKMPVTWASGPRDGVRYQELALEIVERAQGVFLWVFLVVRSLQEGLANSDSILMLQKKLRALPTDLERFFGHILESIESVYQEKLARMFLVALEARRPLGLMTFSFLDEEDPDFAITLTPTPMASAEILSRQYDMRRRINGRSKGLLEVSENPFEELFDKYDVQFLHRTVKDFLSTPNMRAKLSHAALSTYNPCLAIGRALLAAFKAIPEGKAYFEKEAILEFAFHYARQAEEYHGVTDVVMLDELQRTVKIRFQKYLERDSSFLERAVEDDLLLYVDFKLNQQPQLMHSIGGLLLSTALKSATSLPESKYGVPMVQHFLKRGISPNQPVHDSTAWWEFLKWYLKWYFSDEEIWKEHSNWRELARLLLLRGADVQESDSFIDLLLDENDTPRSEAVAAELAITVELLLSHGLDPNQPVSGEHTVWTSFVDKVCRYGGYGDATIWSGVFKAFLRYGANTLAVYTEHGSKESKVSGQVLWEFIVESMTDTDERKAIAALIGSETAYQKAQAQYHSRTTNTLTINSSDGLRSPGTTPPQLSWRGNGAVRGAHSYPRGGRSRNAGRAWRREQGYRSSCGLMLEKSSFSMSVSAEYPHGAFLFSKKVCHTDPLSTPKNTRTKLFC